MGNLSNTKKKVLSNVVWSVFGKLANMGGQLLVAIIVARYLGPEQYGLMNYVISYVALFMVVSEFGLPNIEIRELSANPEKREKLMGTCLRIRLYFSAITYLLIIATLFVFKTNLYTSSLIALYGLSLFSNVFNVIRNYFTSIVKNEYVVKTEIFRTFIGAIIKIILVCLSCPLFYFIIAVLFDTILVASGYIMSYRKLVGPIKDWEYDKTMVKYLVFESFPLVLSGAAIIVYQRIDQVMIGNMIDNTSVGYFSTAEKFLSVILFVPTILTQTIVPILISARESHDVKRYDLLKKKMVSIVVWIAVFMAGFVSLISYPLVYYTYGERYLPTVPVLQVMAWKTVGAALSASSGQIIIMEHLQKWAFIRNVAACGVCVALNLVFIPKFGIMGSAWVTIITVATASYFSNIFIPPYHKVFRLQTYALFLGWRELGYLMQFFKAKASLK